MIWFTPGPWFYKERKYFMLPCFRFLFVSWVLEFFLSRIGVNGEYLDGFWLFINLFYYLDTIQC